MVNINKLKGKIVERGMTIKDVADRMGVNESTVYRKISDDGRTLTVKDANMLFEILELTTEEATAIFFSQHVA